MSSRTKSEVSARAAVPTVAAALRPETSVLADDLGLESQVESSGIGIGNQPSKVFAKFEKLRAQASLGEFRLLAAHKSPVVRAYVGAYLAKELPSAPELHGLLVDAAALQEQSGCSVMTGQTVGGYVAAASRTKL
jgi:hypothetical protein